jgi:hypothetical protein
MDGLSASGLADLAGTTVAEVQRLVDLGILVVRDGVGAFRTGDVQKVRLVQACERAGLPLEGIPLDTLGGILESMGFARMAPDEPIREDERVAEVGPPAGVALVEAGEVQLKGFACPVRLLEASRSSSRPR